MSNSSTSQSEGKFGALIGIAFWLIVGVVIVVGYYKKDHADVFLDVLTQPERISGTVTFEGAPVATGTVHVVVSDAQNRRYVSGHTLAVTKEGGFAIERPRILGGDLCRPLLIAAEFRGSSGKKAVEGEATLYLNWLSPLGERVLWLATVGLIVLLVLQLILFTGTMGQSKARWLFIVMYFFTFLSLALPIAISLVVSQNPYMVAAMEESPIGLIKAKAKGLADAQWLINIGGTVGPEKKLPAATKETSASETGTAAPAASAPASSPAAEPPQQGATGGTPETAQLQCPQPEGSEKRIVGGVAVPFFVVLLAMFGAGINMTLKVPEIQRTADLHILPRDSFNPVTAVGRFFQGKYEAPSALQRITAADIRRELIENYMYLLSAPFLAIAMYYLLQLLAQQVSEPVLVIMAFATGLVSKAVVGGIIDFAETTLRRDKRAPERTSIVAEADNAAAAAGDARIAAANEATARKLEAEAAAKAAEEAKAAQAAAEAAEKLAADAETKRTETDAAAKEAAKVATARLADAKAAVEKAQQDAAAKPAAENAAKAAEEAKARQQEADAAAKSAADEAKKRRDEADAAKKAAGDVAAKVTEAEAAARALTEAEQRLASAEKAEAAAAKAAEQTKLRQAEAEAAQKAAADAAAEAKAHQGEAEAAAREGKEGKTG